GFEQYRAVARARVTCVALRAIQCHARWLARLGRLAVGDGQFPLHDLADYSWLAVNPVSPGENRLHPFVDPASAALAAFFRTGRASRPHNHDWCVAGPELRWCPDY